MGFTKGEIGTRGQIKEDINSRTVWFGTFIFVFVRSKRLGGWVSIIVRQMIA